MYNSDNNSTHESQFKFNDIHDPSFSFKGCDVNLAIAISNVVDGGVVVSDIAVNGVAISNVVDSGVVVVIVSAGPQAKVAIQDAIEEYTRRTCITFRPKNFVDRHYVNFYPGEG